MKTTNRIKLIERQKRRLHILELIEQTLDDDPDFVVDLAHFMGLSKPTNRTGRSRNSQNRAVSPNFSSISQFFGTRNNAWATVQEIVEGSEVIAASVRDQLYKTHRAKFEKRDVPGQKLRKQFRLNSPQKEVKNDNEEG